MTGNAILKKSVQYIKGIGAARAALFNNLGIFTVNDMLTHFPREYEDRSVLKSVSQLEDGEACSFEGYIVSEVTELKPRKGLSIYKVIIRDHTGTIAASWFNQPYIKNVFRTGDRYIFYGKVTKRSRIFEVQNPVYEKSNDDEARNSCRIVPIYPATARLSQNIIRGAISSALEIAEDSLIEYLPQNVREHYMLSEFSFALKNIHFPQSDEAFRLARYRLVFDELLFLQLGLLSMKSAIEHQSKGIMHKPVKELEDFIASLPFSLTNAQTKVFKEIEKDMESDRVMSRLVQGDVGSGKTVVAAMALFKAVRNGYQGSLMVPTEILAEQHFKTLEPLFSGFGIRVALLTGSAPKKQRAEISEGLEGGKIDVLIGTHALIEGNVEFKRLGLVITDEQHRFGVRQRAALSAKGINPDTLVMTATPIPRTLALILYGDLDISIIDELPPGRKPIKTYVVDDSKRERINNFIRKNVSDGRQVYIVCPLVEESDAIEAKSAMELAERIARHDFRELKVGLVHGRMKSSDKDKAMKDFVSGNINILVSTTVIEVGVNVPNATVMVIENAERFGLAQLHQLRGRVGRGADQSHCILYNSGNSNIAEKRMKVMESTNDGFIISEKDLELRGPGEFFGTRQHGIPDLKIANLYRDIEILKKAQESAMNIIRNDRHLAAEENNGLRNLVIEKFKDRLVNI
jgi:ATP-dependent DNA helicase RecG